MGNQKDVLDSIAEVLKSPRHKIKLINVTKSRYAKYLPLLFHAIVFAGGYIFGKYFL